MDPETNGRRRVDTETKTDMETETNSTQTKVATQSGETQIQTHVGAKTQTNMGAKSDVKASCSASGETHVVQNEETFLEQTPEQETFMEQTTEKEAFLAETQIRETILAETHIPTRDETTKCRCVRDGGLAHLTPRMSEQKIFVMLHKDYFEATSITFSAMWNSYHVNK